MSELAEKFFTWNVETLKQLNEDNSIVWNGQSEEIMIKKRFDGANIELMKKLRTIRHKNLAAVIEVTEENQACYSYSEFVPGRSLQSYLDEGKIFNENEALKIILDVCDGLEILHANGIIHRDITAANIILSYDGNVKIIDYGIARKTKQNASRDTYILGTAGYAAPEQFGFSQTDERSDIYAVGVLLNVLLTGKFPNECLCSGRFAKVISRCISIDSSNRFSNVSELKQSLLNKNDVQKTYAGFPGFRNSKTSTKIFASLIYCIIIFFDCIFISISYTQRGLIFSVLQGINLVVSFSVPFCLLFNPCNIQEKAKRFSSLSDSSKSFVKVIFSVIFILFGFFATIFLA